MKTDSKQPAVIQHKIHEDQRGLFLEILRPQDITEKPFGQISVTIAKSGQTKGNHYHKDSTEWFTVVKGEAVFSLYHVETKEMLSYTLTDQEIQTICIPPLWNHSIKNVGEGNAIILLYSDEPFNSTNPDVYRI